MKILITLLLAVGGAGALGQTQSEVSKFYEVTQPMLETLFSSNGNLQQMLANAFEDRDYFYKDKISYWAQSAEWRLQKHADFSVLYSLIEGKRNQQTVKKFMEVSSKGACASAETAIKVINMSVVKVASQGYISESIRARDSIEGVLTEMRRRKICP